MMKRGFSAGRRIIAAPVKLALVVARNNADFWQSAFWEAWNREPLDGKIAWIFFFTNTIAVITAIELFTLRR